MRPNDGQFPHSLALLCDPLVLPLEVRRSGDVASPFRRKRLQVVFELLDRDLRVGGRLLLGLDHLIQIVQLRVKMCQRRTLFLQTAPLPRRAPPVIIVICMRGISERVGFQKRERVCTVR
jgi:hypothetical protein